MKHITLALTLLACAGTAHAQTPQKTAAECGADPPGEYMKLSPAEFDGTLGMGWRIVGNREGCEQAGADLIALYREQMEAQMARLDGHEGQLRAAAGDTARPAELFRRKLVFLRKFALETGDRSDVIYAEATLAYLERDRATLEARRAELAALPKPDWYEAAAANHVKTNPKAAASLVWPRNLNVVDGLLACFEKPYREAYSTACQPTPQQ